MESVQKNRLMTTKNVQHIRCPECKNSPIQGFIYLNNSLKECPICGKTARKTFGISDIIRDGGWTTQEAIDTYHFSKNKKNIEQTIYNLAVQHLTEQGRPITNSGIKGFRKNFYKNRTLSSISEE